MFLRRSFPQVTACTARRGGPRGRSEDPERRGPASGNKCDVNFQQLKHSEIR